MIGWKCLLLFPHFASESSDYFKVNGADYVEACEGTGLIHQGPVSWSDRKSPMWESCAGASTRSSSGGPSRPGFIKVADSGPENSRQLDSTTWVPSYVEVKRSGNWIVGDARLERLQGPLLGDTDAGAALGQRGPRGGRLRGECRGAEGAHRVRRGRCGIYTSIRLTTFTIPSRREKGALRRYEGATAVNPGRGRCRRCDSDPSDLFEACHAPEDDVFKRGDSPVAILQEDQAISGVVMRLRLVRFDTMGGLAMKVHHRL